MLRVWIRNGFSLRINLKQDTLWQSKKDLDEQLKGRS